MHVPVSKIDTQLFNDLFSFLASQISEVIWICTGDYTKQLYISPRFEEIWGLPSDSMYKNIGIWPTTLLPEDLSRTAIRFYDRLNATSNAPITFRIHRPDDQIRFIQDICFDLYDAQGKRVAVCGLAKSLSELEWGELMTLSDKPAEGLFDKSTELLSIINQSLKLSTKSANISLNAPPTHYSILVENREISLTKTQAACLYQLLQGKSSKVIARILNSSPRTIETHLAHIKSKAGCHKTIELISKIKNQQEIANWLFPF